MKLDIGDLVVWRHPETGNVARREITAVRDTGYQWRYPDQGDICASASPNSFASEDSNDPFFDLGWSKVPPLCTWERR